jgi:hypothetical protein
MPSKPGRPPVSTSFKPGNKASLGNMKEHRLSTQLDILLKRVNENEDYDTKLLNAQVLAQKVFSTAMSTDDPRTLLDYFKEIADRTEGKAKQSTDLTSNGKTIVPILGGLSVSGDNGNEENSEA